MPNRRMQDLLSRSALREAWAPLLLLTVVLLAAYILGILWFRKEVRNAAFELARQQAVQSARRIEQSFPVGPGHLRIIDAGDPMIEEVLYELVHQSPNILAAALVDPEGTVRQLLLNRSNADVRFVERVWRDLGSDARDEESLTRAIQRTLPHVETEFILLTIDRAPGVKAPIGALRIFLDRHVQHQVVDLAAARMVPWLMFVLALLAAAVAGGLLIIRRQRLGTERLRRERDEAERLSFVGTLAAGLAHEIRNPINALAMQLEMLEEDLPGSTRDSLHPRVERIREGLGGLERTVHEFLAYAAPQQPKPARVELAPVVAALREEARAASPGRRPVRFEFQVPAGLCAWCDEQALRQILANLISNAIQAQAERDENRTTPGATGGEAVVRLTGVRRNTVVELTIEDAGPGIDPAVRSQVFECFYTTRSEGTGLGLPIARRLTELLGGELVLAREASALGGARFLLRLPACD
ncbi:MAG TPA: HAMP domain-containing sensor histidine kinase [Candidatus Sumerlaeota bacterium]|nr:HAMP domain-containing sensor histidine kinase [Candidatus Sumerlaeota bacterium]